MSRPRALVLLSGGLDSATCLAIAHHEGFDCLALTFAYGQRHGREVAAAGRVAAALGAAAHQVVTLPLGETVRSALTGDQAVPKADSVEEIGAEIPVTYVPARNTIFLAHALGIAESTSIRDLFIGVNAVDYSGYPDCRPAFIAAFEHLANLATRAAAEGRPFHLHAPLLELSKGEIIRRGLALGVDYALTHSCYDPTPDGRACGHCDSCLLRRRGFAEAGLVDPVAYVEE
ncbi:MAG: 7-cyano-7-deazaguanine synthase QueC [Nitrospirae bacterium CG18_big_fil_WC_8_21_14_2_50_70_55]|nr:7-cyano-7-deazaguanine synthase QueC [Deltaproteobacteria bacterium]OIP65445.1 MAG: 7-cyano-7-deazaguanine synthase QueC [Nitrospirae bacterium CG2_30_70_394]PIQ05511.1 MAG: 7-cyano-7-deazaguanine synthase QueC [Nitrospirae bacterium CG18_big_fil_WC_8_21_14_2_50_70_55]PIU80205.1 MAG: 7-cyano-7-deazaguanine synthase QueC [Nitrospirae bacterium CG06_land_8_20_14_3_00_70_43]PIX82309.1 MAG: 7-cyano-7-deazaguanine synthase QueC [Nitrospirae bacterium CG_4_10_14_3_um_filter_70_108]PJB95330.1 MAG: